MRLYSIGIRIISIVFIICLSGGSMAYDKTTTNQGLTKAPNYPKNEKGQTYGPIADVIPIEALPDFIFAGSVDGISGYMLKKDHLGERGRTVPLYDVDEKTIIGSISSSALNQNPRETPNFPKNKYGQTYGSDSDATSYETRPDLISAFGVNGTLGYVLKKDLYGELPKTPEEALAIQKNRPAGGRDIPLYDVDGKTIIGVFHIG